MLNIALLGPGGFIAKHILANNTAIQPYHCRFYPDSYINHFVQRLCAAGINVVINAIGKTGFPNIDSLENDKGSTFFTNTTLPISLATACDKVGIHFVQLSSGCCFYGQSPHSDARWKEADFANPESTYSRSKYAADLVLDKLPNTTIIRLRMPISYMNDQRNLLTKLIGYKQVLEEPNSVTFVDDLVRTVQFVIDKRLTGIYHCASPKPITHSMLLDEYRKYDPNHTYEKITAEQLKPLVKAPRSNCILNVEKLQKEGFVFEDTDIAVERYVRQFIEGRKTNE